MAKDNADDGDDDDDDEDDDNDNDNGNDNNNDNDNDKILLFSLEAQNANQCLCRSSQQIRR